MLKRNHKGYSLVLKCFFMVLAFFAILSCGTSTSNTSSARPLQNFLNVRLSVDWSKLRLLEGIRFAGTNSLSFAAISLFDRGFGIHGSFPPGETVVCVGSNGYPEYTGTTTSQYEFNSPSIWFNYTLLDFPDNQIPSREEKFQFAIVGEVIDYEVIPYWPQPLSYSDGREVEENVNRLLGIQERQYEPDCVNADVFSFCFENRAGVIVGTVNMQEGQYHGRIYVAVLSGNAQVAYTGARSGPPILFRIGTELFMFYQWGVPYTGYGGITIKHLDESGETWSNADWSV